MTDIVTTYWQGVSEMKHEIGGIVRKLFIRCMEIHRKTIKFSVLLYGVGLIILAMLTIVFPLILAIIPAFAFAYWFDKQFYR
jgi:hypothetical protein